MAKILKMLAPPLTRRQQSLKRRFPGCLMFRRVTYTWPCFNCHTPMTVDRAIFRQLQSGQLTGLRCNLPTCLPPSNDGAVLIKVA